jgi:hypothetical protein
MNSPRFRPAGLLVEHAKNRVMIDGGDSAPKAKLTQWLVTDEHGELMSKVRRLCRSLGLAPSVSTYSSQGLSIEPDAVTHTSHDAYGYTIRANGRKIVWAPEFLKFPKWAKGADLMFAEAAGWNRPILFRGGVGGHASVAQVATDAQKNKIKKLVYAHIGRPTIKAIDSGARAEFGEFGRDGDVYVVTKARIVKTTS